MGDLTRNFSRCEFMCLCGCGFSGIQNSLVYRLQLARKDHGIFRITSGCRCVTHNRNVGGKSTSSHLKGWAVDIACDSSGERFSLLDTLLCAGFQRIGVGTNFIHVDMDPEKPHSLVWLY